MELDLVTYLLQDGFIAIEDPRELGCHAQYDTEWQVWALTSTAGILVVNWGSCPQKFGNYQLKALGPVCLFTLILSECVSAPFGWFSSFTLRN